MSEDELLRPYSLHHHTCIHVRRRKFDTPNASSISCQQPQAVGLA